MFEEVARLRTQAVNVQGATPEQRAAAEGELSGALRQMMISVEAYPQLQSNQNFLGLQRELTDTEDRIAAGRRFYNANVGDYNTRIEAFPSNLIAGGFKFEKAGYFEVKDEQVRSVPQVSFGTIGSVAGEQAPPQMQQGGPSSGQIHPQMPGDQGNYQGQPQFPAATRSSRVSRRTRGSRASTRVRDRDSHRWAARLRVPPHRRTVSRHSPVANRAPAPRSSGPPTPNPCQCQTRL